MIGIFKCIAEMTRSFEVSDLGGEFIVRRHEGVGVYAEGEHVVDY